jgi:hypothetical protein
MIHLQVDSEHTFTSSHVFSNLQTQFQFPVIADFDTFGCIVTELTFSAYLIY